MKILSLGLSLLAGGFSAAEEPLNLTDVKGRTIRAELMELTDKDTLKMKVNGKAFDIAMDQLVKEDQDRVREWSEEKKAAGEQAEYSKELFFDDFAKDGFGEAWGHYKSGSVVKGGVLEGITPEGSDHAAVDNVKIEPQQDIEVSVKFRFAGPKGKRLDVWLDDKDFKGAHAGHVCRVSLSPNDLSIMDAKEGSFKKEIYEKKKAGEELDKETLKQLEGTSARFDARIKDDKWHTLAVRTSGDEVTAFIDGKKAGSLKSPGIAHPTKTVISLTTNQAEIQYDDFSIRAKKSLKTRR